jgi:DNA ligase D-like protein (predicted polymerase)
LLWFANQRAVEYHVTLFRVDHWDQPDYLILDLDPPEGSSFAVVVQAAQLIRQALTEARMDGAVKTSGAKGVHVFVPLATGSSPEDVAAATRAVAVRAERIDPDLATTAFVKDERGGKVFLDSTRAGGATVVSAYSPRIRPGVPVSFPVAWDDLDQIAPSDFTISNAAGLLRDADPWADRMPPAQQLDADLVAEGHTVPVARVQAMHEGKRRARSQRNTS